MQKLEITVSKNELLSKLKAVSKVINTSSKVMPAHGKFLFEINEEFKVTGADESGNITAVVDCEYQPSGDCISCLVDPKTIMDGLKELPEQPIMLNFSSAGKGFEIIVLYSSGKYNLHGEESDGFSVLKNNDDSSTRIIIPSSDLLKGIKAVYQFANHDDLRPVMISVFMALKEGEYTFCATDAHTLAMLEFKPEPSTIEPIPFELVLPIKACNLLIEILSKDISVEMEINKKNVSFQFGIFKLVYRLIDGTYPLFRSVIPTKNDKAMTVNSANLTSSLRRASIFANKASLLIKMSLTERNLNISGKDIDFNQSAEENIPCNYDSDEFTIGFKSSLLLQCIEAIDTEEVKITFSDPTRAALILPDDENIKMMVLIMPMMVNI